METTTWEDKARNMQQNFYDNLSDRDWDCFKLSEQVYLLKNIGFALYGPPEEEPGPTNNETGYNTKQLQEIKLLCKRIKENDCHTTMKGEVIKHITTLLKKNCTEELTPKEYLEREYYIGKICGVIDSYDERNSTMVKNLLCDIASALYCITVSANTLFDNPSSKKIFEEAEEIYEEISPIMNQYRGTMMSVIFVVTQVEVKKTFHALPEAVFRVPNDVDGVDKVRFIDRNQRVYRGWDQYLQDNKLQKGPYCYPESGIYNGDKNFTVQVEFGVTPASKLLNKALNAGDMISTVVGVGAGVVGIAALIPAITIAAPVMVGAMIGGAMTGVYGVGRGIENIVDRRKHDEDIGLDNAEARNTYIAIVGSSLGIFAMGATSATAMLAREGQVIGAVGQFVVNALQISALGVNGIGIATAAYNLQQKYLEGNLTTLDVFQFSSNVLFFSMSAVNFRTAQTIITETQQATLNDFRSNLRSKRHQKGYDKLARNTGRGLDATEANAKVIRSINNIKNPDDFFSGVVRINKHHTRGITKMRFGDNAGSVVINEAVKVEPTAFANMNKVDRIKVIEATKNLGNGNLNRPGFDKFMVNISAINGMTFDNNLVIVESKVCHAFGANSLQEIDANGKGMCFTYLTANGLMIIEKIISNPNVTREIVRVTVKLFEKLWDGALPEDFVIRMEFTIKFFVKQVKLMDDAYQLARKAAMRQPHFNQEMFDSDYGFVGDRIKYFTECIEILYSITQNICEFREEYETFRATRES